MDDRHTRLIAAITARRKLAEAADPLGNRLSISWPRRAGKDALLRFLNANDPAQILRDTAAHLRIVERHAPCTDEHRDVVLMSHWDGPFWRHAPDVMCHQHASPTPWPCPDWLDVASSYPEVTHADR